MATITELDHVVAGLRLRPYAGEPDLAEIVRIENLEAEADHLVERASLESTGADFGNPSDSFDPARDVTLAEVDGTVVGISMREVVETTDARREFRTHGAVDPAWRRRGIGRAMLEDNERRLRELAAAYRDERRPVLGSWSGEPQAGDRALLESSGYRPVRWFFDMVRPNLDDVPEIGLPDGLEVRPIPDIDMARRVWHADIEAFADHWGGFDHSEERFQRSMDNPSNDLSLWIVAFDGDEVAGGILNWINAPENELLGLRRGWLASVFTRRPWRRRGLAKALIARSLVAFRERGMTDAALGVDGDNPSGALGLYEGMGFEVAERYTAWRKELA